MEDSPRPRGRPPHNPDDVKQHTLSIRTTKALKDELVRASKVSGRSLAGEIEFRLSESLAADREKDPRELWLDRIMADQKARFIKQGILEALGMSVPGGDVPDWAIHRRKPRSARSGPKSKSRRS
jgi:hypothetical protein